MLIRLPKSVREEFSQKYPALGQCDFDFGYPVSLPYTLYQSCKSLALIFLRPCLSISFIWKCTVCNILAMEEKSYFLYSAGCILVGIGYFSSLIGFGFNSYSNAEDSISVATYNIANLRLNHKEVNPQELQSFKTLLEKDEIPDIFCIQEGGSNQTRERLQNTLEYPYYFKEKGTLLFSKYPFEDSGIIPFEKTSNSCIWGDLKTPQGTVRVYSVHLQSNWLAPAAMRVAEDGDPRKKETWNGVAEVMRLYKNAASRRASQSERVAAHIAKSPHPVILCGDLNDTPVSYVYHVLSENLTDSFCEKGAGFGFTYAGKIPALRIDYVMSDDHFEVTNHQVHKLELSDHYPVSVRLKRLK